MLFTSHPNLFGNVGPVTEIKNNERGPRWYPEITPLSFSFFSISVFFYYGKNKHNTNMLF